MRKSKRIYFLVLCLIFAQNLLSQSYKEINPFRRYSKNRYLIGTGECAISEPEYKKKAYQKALSEISANIEVKIKEVIYDKLKQERGFTRVTTEIISKSITKATLPSPQKILEKKTKGIYKVVVAVDRLQFYKILIQRIKEINKEIVIYYNSAKKVKKSNLRNFTKLIEEGITKTLDAMAMIERARIISAPLRNKPALPELKKRPADFYVLFNNFISKLKIKKLAGDKQECRDGEPLNKPLKIKVLNNNLPVPACPVKFQALNGEISFSPEESETDDKGIASTSLLSVLFGAEKYIRIKAFIDFKKLLPENIYKILKPEKSTEFLIRLYLPPCERIRVKAEETVKKLLKNIKSKNSIVVSDFYYQQNNLGSEFSRFFTDKIKSFLTSKNYKVLDYFSEDYDYEITGHYYKLEDYVEVTTELRKEEDIIKSITTRIPLTHIMKCFISPFPPDIPTVNFIPIKHSTIKIDVWTPHGRTSTYKEGEEFKIMFKADRDCFIRIYDFDSQGNAYLLFPNEYSEPSGKIEGDKVYTVPDEKAGYAFQVRPPFGYEYVVIFASYKSFKYIDRQLKKCKRYIDVINLIRRKYARGKNLKKGYGEGFCTVTTIQRE